MKKLSFAVALLLMIHCLSFTAFAETGADVIMRAGTTQAFSDEAVPAKDINTILNAGLKAESAMNQQPWLFVALTDKAMMKEVAGSGMMPPGAAPAGANGAAPAGTNGTAPPRPANGAKAGLGDSPLAILVYMDEGSRSPDPSFDCGLAVQNMYIAAVSLGYGAKIVYGPVVTLNGEKHDHFCDEFGIDRSLKAVSVLLIGKADDAVDSTTGASERAAFKDKVRLIEGK
ncbi:MAG: nitroreductase family protein [Stomatobaculum sp.]|nr:nitroreductase family protein [Stomatobaculum sp.]